MAGGARRLSRVHIHPPPHPTRPRPADVAGDSIVSRVHIHPPTGLVALSTGLRAARGEGEAAHSRVPLLQLIDGEDPAGAPRALPLHSGGWAGVGLGA